MKATHKRTVFVVTGSTLFSAAWIGSPVLLPFADTSLMLITVGVAAPAGLGYAVWQWIDYVATRHDVRIVRRVQPEPELKADLR
jgi:low affinity Fe/Cu permease